MWKSASCFKSCLFAASFYNIQRYFFTKIPKPHFQNRYLITMILGGGLGPELMHYVADIFKQLDAPVDFEQIEVRSAEDVENAIISTRRNGVAIQSTLESTASVTSPNLRIRRELDLYLNIVHCKPYCNLKKARHKDVDIVIIRQNTEGEYSLLEHESVPGVVESLKIITRRNSERIARRAFEFAIVRNRKKITVVHKANIMKLSDGLFLKESGELAKKFPRIKQDQIIVDNCCMQLVSDPKQFDLLLMPNLYGLIVSNILCGMLGGPGLFAGCNFGENCAIFEPATRNVGADLVGKNVANPIAMLNASVELLIHIGQTRSAQLLDQAIFNTICKSDVHTPDLGGKNSSTDVVAKIKENIVKLISQEKS